MTLAVNGAEIEEFVAKSVALLMLRENILQRDGKLAQTRGLRPVLPFFINGFCE